MRSTEGTLRTAAEERINSFSAANAGRLPFILRTLTPKSLTVELSTEKQQLSLSFSFPHPPLLELIYYYSTHNPLLLKLCGTAWRGSHCGHYYTTHNMYNPPFFLLPGQIQKAQESKFQPFQWQVFFHSKYSRSPKYA